MHRSAFGRALPSRLNSLASTAGLRFCSGDGSAPTSNEAIAAATLRNVAAASQEQVASATAAVATSAASATQQQPAPLHATKAVVPPRKVELGDAPLLKRAPAATPAAASIEDDATPLEVGVFIADVTVKAENELGLDYDPAEFVVTLLDARAASVDAGYPRKVSFHGIRDKKAGERLRRLLYPHPSEPKQLHPDITVDPASGKAKGGQEIVVIPSSSSHSVVLRSALNRAAAGKYSVVPLWRLPPPPQDDDAAALEDLTDVVAISSALAQGCGNDGIVGAVSRIIRRARRTGTPLDCVSEKPAPKFINFAEVDKKIPTRRAAERVIRPEDVASAVEAVKLDVAEAPVAKSRVDAPEPAPEKTVIRKAVALKKKKTAAKPAKSAKPSNVAKKASRRVIVVKVKKASADGKKLAKARKTFKVVAKGNKAALIKKAKKVAAAKQPSATTKKQSRKSKKLATKGLEPLSLDALAESLNATLGELTIKPKPATKGNAAPIAPKTKKKPQPSATRAKPSGRVNLKAAAAKRTGAAKAPGAAIRRKIASKVKKITGAKSNKTGAKGNKSLASNRDSKTVN